MCVNTGCSSCTGNCGCNCTSCCNNDCNNCCEVTDPCQEQGCGCDFYVPAGCVRITGNPLECLEIVTGQTLEEALESINSIVCDLSSGEDGEDGDSAYQIWLNLGNSGTEQDFIDSLMGDDGQGVDHVSFTSSTGGGGAGVAGETDTYTVWGDLAETINLGTFVVYNGDDGQGVDHVSFTSSTGGGGAGVAGETDTYTVWGDVGETINLGTFVVYNGTDGTVGNDGEFGGWSGEWIYDISTVPGAIQPTDLRFDDTNLSLVTEIYIHETNADSTDYSAFLDSFSNTVSGTNHYGLVRIWKRFDSNTFFYGEITLTQDNGSYRTISVTPIQYNGTFTDTDNVVVSFTPNGVAGQPQLDTGWKEMNSWNGNWGFPAYTGTFSHPMIRVIGREVFIEGTFTLPLATGPDGDTLVAQVADYPDAPTNNTLPWLYLGTDGGFDVTTYVPGGAVTHGPIVPPELYPTESHRINFYQLSSRAIQDTGGDSRGLLLSTVFNGIRLFTDGTLYTSTLLDADDGAAPTTIENSPFHLLISKHTIGDPIYPSTHPLHYSAYDFIEDTSGTLITGVTYKIKTYVAGDDFLTVGASANATGEVFIATGTTPTTWSNGSTLVHKIEKDIVDLDSGRTWPLSIDAERTREIGGFFFVLSTNYPIDETLTDAQVLAAWNSI